MRADHREIPRSPSLRSRAQPRAADLPRPMRIAGLFAGIGGLELGLHRAGHRAALFCEIDPAAQRVLRARFPDVPLCADIRDLPELPPVDLVCAGFPCQDLSQAGKTAGIEGERSGLVSHVFRLLERTKPARLLLENVPFMLALQGGRAMQSITDALTGLGYAWAYRVIDARAFGKPQRRLRVILVASLADDPRHVLLADDAGEPPRPVGEGLAKGFYWTEGARGLGWAPDAVPTLKGGSGLGIPSPPAIWMPSGEIITPDLRDVERLQGFPAGWTRPATDAPKAKKGLRWKLVGNAVSVPLAEWVGRRLARPGRYRPHGDQQILSGSDWPAAAWSLDGRVYASSVSRWPVRRTQRHLAEFLRFPRKPLSIRAAAGFLDRATKSSLRFEPGFLDAVRAHLKQMTTVAMETGA